MIFKNKPVLRQEYWGFEGSGSDTPPKVIVVSTITIPILEVNVAPVSLQEQLKVIKEKEKIQHKVSSSFSDIL